MPTSLRISLSRRRSEDPSNERAVRSGTPEETRSAIQLLVGLPDPLPCRGRVWSPPCRSHASDGLSVLFDRLVRSRPSRIYSEAFRLGEQLVRRRAGATATPAQRCHQCTTYEEARDAFHGSNIIPITGGRFLIARSRSLGDRLFSPYRLLSPYRLFRHIGCCRRIGCCADRTSCLVGTGGGFREPYRHPAYLLARSIRSSE